MLNFLIENYEFFAVPLALGFFWLSEWFYDEHVEIVGSLSNYSTLFVFLLVLAGAIGAYWCGHSILSAGDRDVANTLISGFLGFISHKRFFNQKD